MEHVVMPGGSGSAQPDAWGDDGSQIIRDFVDSAEEGLLSESVPGAYLASSQYRVRSTLINARVFDQWPTGLVGQGRCRN